MRVMHCIQRAVAHTTNSRCCCLQYAHEAVDVIAAFRWVKQVVQKMKDVGLWDTTIVALWGDHGYQLVCALRLVRLG